MNSLFKKRITLLVISVQCLFLCQAVLAEGSVRMKARAWPTQVTLGDEIKLNIQVERPRGFSIAPPSPKVAVTPFEIKSIESSAYSENSQVVKQAFLIRLTVFKLGDLQIPPISIHFTDTQGRGGLVWTEPVKIKVSSILKGAKDKEELRPIKGPVSLDTRAFWALIMSLVALLLLITLITKVILRRRNKVPLDPESLKPPHERAMLELGRLEAKAYLSEKKVKEFYSELADILRRYLDRRYQMETLELTTFEILKDLKEKDFDAAMTEKMKELFENSDLVKFAKMIPPRLAADRMTTLLREIVERTTPSPEELVKK